MCDLLRIAVLDARVEAWRGEQESGGRNQVRFHRIACLLDAIHNLPGFLEDYSGWNQEVFETILKSQNDPQNPGLGDHLLKRYQTTLEHVPAADDPVSD